MNRLSGLIKSIFHFLVIWFVDAISLLITASILSGVTIEPVGEITAFMVAVMAALVLGFVNLLICPLLLLLAMPLGWIAIFVSGFFLNGIVLWITAALMEGFTVEGFWPAFWGGLMLSLLNTIIITLLNIDDDDSFFDNLVERRVCPPGKKCEPGNRARSGDPGDGWPELPAHHKGARRRIYAHTESDDG